jgi:hypothetical protein
MAGDRETDSAQPPSKLPRLSVAADSNAGACACVTVQRSFIKPAEVFDQ